MFTPVHKPNRISIVGTTGAGKTTLAKRISKILCLHHIELDALYWLPNWIPVSRDEFRKKVDQETSGVEWVIDGNYRSCRDIIWSKANTLIWLDYPLWILFYRLCSRTIARWYEREHLWGTNHESLLKQVKFWSEDSLFNWLFKTYKSRRDDYAALFNGNEWAEINKYRLQSDKEVEGWIATYCNGQAEELMKIPNGTL